jgi:hypothetical protein
MRQLAVIQQIPAWVRRKTSEFQFRSGPIIRQAKIEKPHVHSVINVSFASPQNFTPLVRW